MLAALAAAQDASGMILRKCTGDPPSWDSARMAEWGSLGFLVRLKSAGRNGQSLTGRPVPGLGGDDRGAVLCWVSPP